MEGNWNFNLREPYKMPKDLSHVGAGIEPQMGDLPLDQNRYPYGNQSYVASESKTKISVRRDDI